LEKIIYCNLIFFIISSGIIVRNNIILIFMAFLDCSLSFSLNFRTRAHLDCIVEPCRSLLVVFKSSSTRCHTKCIEIHSENSSEGSLQVVDTFFEEIFPQSNSIHMSSRICNTSYTRFVSLRFG
jgi:hypothetical protein